MCLAIPGKILEINEKNGLSMGRIDYSGTVNEACLAYVPDAKIGDFVIVHAGFALNIIDEVEAEKRLTLWREMAKEAYEEEPDEDGASEL